jgi:protein gp37
MGDLFHESVPDEFLSQLWPHLVKNEHIHMLLTKRIDRAAAWPGPWPDHIWLGTTIGHTSTKWRAEYLRRSRAKVRFISAEPLLESIVPLNLEGIHQVIVGGESGPGYRKLEREWVLEIREACEKAGVAFFFKQDAGARPGLRPYLEIDGEKLVFHQFPGELTPPTIWTPEVEVV